MDCNVIVMVRLKDSWLRLSLSSSDGYSDSSLSVQLIDLGAQLCGDSCGKGQNWRYARSLVSANLEK